MKACVVGLLAETAATLTEDEYQSIRALGALTEAELNRLLLSTDRFISPDAGFGLTPELRTLLLDLFGLFGIRSATGLVRSGSTSSARGLSRDLTALSGIGELR